MLPVNSIPSGVGRRERRTARRKTKPTTMAAALAACLLPVLVVQSATPPRSGPQVYRDYCANCHSGGWQGAPVANDRQEWTSRLEKGEQALFDSVKDGLNGMPPMGTCTDCTDAELQAAIKEMLNF